MAEQTNGADSDDAIYAEFDAISLQEWLDTYVPTATYPELHACLKAAYLGEFGLETSEQGCLNLLYLFGWDSEDEFLIFGASDERYHTHLGNDAFPKALADAIGKDRIQTGAEFKAASGKEGGPFTLEFASGEPVECDHLVFALPFTKLRQANLKELELKAIKREIIRELSHGTNAKVMFGTTSRPWWDVHNESGLLTTDLPVQQGWDSTQGQSAGTGGVWTNFVGGDQGVASGQGTPEAWLQARMPELEQIWPGMEAAWDGTAVRMHWPTHKWTLCSYTCYTVGQWAYWSLEGRRNGNVHFCGEHCSLDFQGWMEGGAETGGLVAAEILDDYGVGRSERHQAAIGMKLEVAQACFHGDQLGVLRPSTRRRTVASARTR